MAGDEVKPADLADGDAAATDPQSARLPDDVLANVLRRVPPRWLAASRCVCRAWRDAVDGRRLLRADLLPLSLAGLFIHFDDHKFPEFLARPSSRAVSGSLSFLPSTSPQCGHIWDDDCDDWRDYNIRDHCNGLLLLSNNRVVNPATQWWNTLPTCPSEHDTRSVLYREHLVYDPVLSPYYEVFMIPTLGNNRPGDKVHPSEWAPSLCKMYVFSSKSGCWEEKNFVREGDAAGIYGEMQVSSHGRFNAVYFRGTLYVHFRANFVMRISVPNNTYSVIKPPVDIEDDTRDDYYPYVQIARSKRGLYFVELDKGWHRMKCWLRVWILNESCGQMEWILKHDKDLKLVLATHRFYQRVQWVLEDINYNLFLSSSSPEDHKKATTENKFEWNSDNDEDEDMADNCCLEGKEKAIVEKFEWSSSNHSALNNGDMVGECYLDEEHYDNLDSDDIEVLGFHPYKEIVLLSASVRTGLAYHLNGSKIEKLGNIYPKDYIHFKALINERERIKSFAYTPCWIQEFPGNK
ncbi:hypothetical protein ACQ4PT_059762 [Festuca glaucescens]